MTRLADKLAPAIAGPNVSAVCDTVEQIVEETLGVAATEIVAALDTRDPVWDPDRPLWHLTLLERERGIIPVEDLSPAERYRVCRMRDVGEWSQGLWPDLLALAAAWIGAPTAEPDKVLVYAWPLMVLYLFHPNVTPTGGALEILKAEVRTTIQDVAGYVLAEGPPGLVFQFDIGPGFDVGAFADVITQEG